MTGLAEFNTATAALTAHYRAELNPYEHAAQQEMDAHRRQQLDTALGHLRRQAAVMALPGKPGLRKLDACARSWPRGIRLPFDGEVREAAGIGAAARILLAGPADPVIRRKWGIE